LGNNKGGTMAILDLTQVLRKLKTISDEHLVKEINGLGLHITDSKFNIAFSAYGLTKFLSGASREVLRCNVQDVPDEVMESIRWNGVFLFRSYTTFLFMRSEQLEFGLDSVTDDSPLRPFRDFFRNGSIRRGDDTIAQHIRNSLAHGTFELSSDLEVVTFEDWNWKAKIKTKDFFDGLCEEVYRFYCAAFKRKY
jgi:hypothetical protein